MSNIQYLISKGAKGVKRARGRYRMAPPRGAKGNDTPFGPFFPFGSFGSSRGFSFMEIIIVMGIIFILMGFATINLVKTQRTASVTSSVDSLTTDLASQQTKAMEGSSESGTSGDNYGVYFMPDRYILFHGATFSQADTSNFTVMLDSTLSFNSITFPNNSLIFSRESGEMLNFANGQNTVTLKNTVGGEQKTITVNRYGVITGVN